MIQHKSKGGAQDVFYSQSNIVPLPMLSRASGVRMWDEEGKEYIDASSGPIVSNIGHGNERVAEAMHRQALTLDFAYSRVARHRPNIALTERISALAGPGFDRVCLASGGSEAMEIALKFLRQYALATGRPEKRRIITLMPSYHGGTIGTLAITGDAALDPFLEGFAVKSERIPAPLQYRVPEGETPESHRMICAEALEAKIREIGARNVLAFVVEPVGGLATGALPLSEDYANRVREICTRQGVWLVYDEILCGTGRTGDFLASHAWPDAPGDIVVLAKGLGAGYAPLGAMLAPATMVDHLAELTGFNFSHTYNANPITCATGLAVLDEYDRLGLLRASREQGTYLKARIEALASRHPAIGEVRGRGMLMAVELIADPVSRTPFPESFLPTERIRICGLAHGLILYSRRTAGGAYGDWVMIAPPLTITRAECDELAERFDAALTDFARAAQQHMAGVA